MAFFKKKITIFQEQNKDRWLAAREALEAAGIGGIQTGSYEANPVGGCGAKLDPRDFGPGGKIDRNTYYIRIWAEDEHRARAVLEEIQ